MARYLATFVHISANLSRIVIGKEGKFVYSDSTILLATQLATGCSLLLGYFKPPSVISKRFLKRLKLVFDWVRQLSLLE